MSLDVIPYERDVDLLLLEEFHTNYEFARWIVQQVVGPAFDPGVFISAHHSVDSSIGESDLEVRFAGCEGRGWRLLIENKIDAALQPRQAERYLQRGESYRSHGECEQFATALVAPASYLGGGHASLGFTAAVSYERIVEWFRSAEPSSARFMYRASFLERAIERAEGVTPAAYDAPATSFWKAYRDLADGEFRHLNMVGKRDAPRRATGTWAEFVPVGLPPGCWRIVHDIGSGVAYLMFPRMSQRLHELEERLGDPPAAIGARYQKRGKSGTVTIETAKLRTRDAFAPQADIARESLRSIDQLYRWARRAR